MNNISLKGESVYLQSNLPYIVIDPIYINDVKDYVGEINVDNFDFLMRNSIFPYTKTPYTTFFFTDGIDKRVEFFVDSIKASTDSDNYLDCFSNDSGIIVFIEHAVLIDFIKKFDFDLLVESLDEIPINIEYWNSLTAFFNVQSYALILGLGINSKNEFKGSGCYKITLPHL